MTALRKRAHAERVVEIEAGNGSPGLTIGDLAQFVEACQAAGIHDGTRFDVITITRGDFPSHAKILRANLWEGLPCPVTGQVGAFVYASSDDES